MRDIVESEDTYRAHFAAAPALRERFDRTRAQLVAGAFVHALDTVEKSADKRGTVAFHVRGYEKVVKQAYELAASPLPLPEAVRERAREVVAEDERRRTEADVADPRAALPGEVSAHPCDPA